MRPSRSTGCNNAGAAGGVGDEPSGTAGVGAGPTPGLCDMIDHRWRVLPSRSGPMGVNAGREPRESSGEFAGAEHGLKFL